MAFFSLMLVYIIVALIILGLIILTGLVLLIVGLVHRRKNRTNGKKYPRVMIISGSVLMGLPVLAVIVFLFATIGPVVKSGMEIVDYDSIPDRWNNELTMEGQAASQAIKELLTSADSNDKAAFESCFSKQIRSKDDFSETVDGFFESYPGGLNSLELKTLGSSGGYEGSYSYGYVRYTCKSADDWYCIYLDYIYSSDDPECVGVESFKILNAGGLAEMNKFDDEGIYIYEGKYLVCSIKTQDEVPARVIGDNAYEWTDSTRDVKTISDMKEILARYHNANDPKLIEIIGEPNAVSKDYSGYATWFYELATENGEPRYAGIEVRNTGAITSASLYTEDDYKYGELY